MQVRNTLVAVRLDPIAAEKKVGDIIVSTHGDQFATGVVTHVGPGNLHSEGGRSETHDLHPGDRVLVKAFEIRPGRIQGSMEKQPTSIEYTYQNEKVNLYEQTFVALILD
jgi:co-chaperonin GroES (HSP10)